MMTKNEVWAERLNRCRHQSGSIKAFCAAEGVTTSSFYNWRKKLYQIERSTALVPVTMPKIKSASTLSIELRSGHKLEVGRDTDLTLLKSVVSILEAYDVR